MPNLNRRPALETDRRAGPGPDPRGRRPNILLLYTDQHNASVLGSVGHPDVQTPHLDRLASEGVQFTRAYCQDGVCLPSRSSMLTGQYCRAMGVLWNCDIPSWPERFHPLPLLLQEHGYRTVAFGKRHVASAWDVGFDYTATVLDRADEPADEYYLDWVREQGQYDEAMRDFAAQLGGEPDGRAPLSCRISKLKPENTMEAYVAQKTIDFLREAQAHDRPFFCWCAFKRPHQPYTPLPEYAARYDPQKVTLPPTLYESPSHLPPMLRVWRDWREHLWCLGRAAEDITLYQRYIAYYYALVTEVGEHIGRILEVLDEEGLAEDTIVMYTSDHGDFVGAHGLAEKACLGHNVYEDTLAVPLIARWPGRFQENYLADDLVELIDLYPTLLELTGIEQEHGWVLPSRSLVPVLAEGRPLGRSFAISENWSQLTAIGERHKLGVWLDHQPGGYGDMLFDRQTDPHETHNLAGTPQGTRIERQLRDSLIEWTRSTAYIPPQYTDFQHYVERWSRP